MYVSRKNKEMMKSIKLIKICILFLMLPFLLLKADEVFEQSVFNSKPTQIGQGFAAVEESDFVPKLSKYQSSEFFSSEGQEIQSLPNSFQGFEAVTFKQEGSEKTEFPVGFEQAGQRSEERNLTDQQKKSDLTFQQRSEEEKSKLEIWWKLQEANFFNQRKALWKSYEKKADSALSIEKKYSQVHQKKIVQEQKQNLLQKLQDANLRISEQEKIARDYASKLEELKSQRFIALQRIMIQQSTAKNFDRQKKEGSNAAPIDVTNRIDYLASIDTQSRAIEKQLQQTQKIIQDARQQAEEAQKGLDSQSKSSFTREEQY